MTHVNPIHDDLPLKFALIDFFFPAFEGPALEACVSNVAIWNVATGHMPVDPRESEEKFWDGDSLGDSNYSEQALALIEEEVEELREAVKDLDKVGTLDAIADILFTLFGLAAKAGLGSKVAPALLEVIRSNNTKIPEPGEEPVILENGKIGKRAGYKPPNLQEILDETQYPEEEIFRKRLYDYIDNKESEK